MSTIPGNPVGYFLDLNDRGDTFSVNELIGREIRLEFTGEIQCIKCGRFTKTSFAQGYCYPCFISAPETEECVLRPELCKAHEGIAREMEYAKEHCLIDHYVYLAFSGGLKVGVTRHTQVPTRWIDQGAGQAIRVARTPNRYLAGIIEVDLKKHFHDKTNWKTMLMNLEQPFFDLVEEKQNAISLLHPDFRKYACDDDHVETIVYPVDAYPAKIASVNPHKTPIVQQVLTGIRGQYLLFDNGSVLNVRKYGGYQVQLSW